MKRILVVVGSYLPGFKGGGPIRTIANLVELLGDEFDFRIVTADRDLGEERAYAGIQKGEWQRVGKGKVRYLAPEEQTWDAWRRLLNTLEYDLIYLSSFFSTLTVQTLWLRRFKQIPNVPAVLAPRGEFSRGALAIKSYKKHPYLAAANLSDLAKDIVWHASSEYEAQDIRRELSAPAHVVMAGLPIAWDASDSVERVSLNAGDKTAGHLRAVFLSRLAPKKNLDMALRLLEQVRGQVQFDIYGTRDDEGYWRICERMIGRLPPNVRGQYCGAALPDQVNRIFSNYHLLLFPTRGENFGYVILEALFAGCPVLISDRTPWRDLEKKGIGWDVPLAEPGNFRAIIQKCIDMDAAEFACWSTRACRFATEFVEARKKVVPQEYRNLFTSAGQR